MLPEREPWPQFFIADHHARSLKHVFNRYRQHIESCGAGTLAHRYMSWLPDKVCDLGQSRISVDDSRIEICQNSQAVRLQFVWDANTLQESTPMTW
jgi:hypothetical protein